MREKIAQYILEQNKDIASIFFLTPTGHINYYTSGEYDVVLVLEAANDEIIVSFLLESESKGNFRSITLKAFPLSEGAKIIEKLP